MVSRAAGTIEIVGLRAILYDVRNYIRDANSLTTANKQIDASVKRTEELQRQAATRSLQARRRLFDAQSALDVAEKRQIEQRDKLTARASDLRIQRERKESDLRVKKGAGTLSLRESDSLNRRIEDLRRQESRISDRIVRADLGRDALGAATSQRKEGVRRAVEDIERIEEDGQRKIRDSHQKTADLQRALHAEEIARRKKLLTLGAVGVAATAGIVGASAVGQFAQFEKQQAKVKSLTDASNESVDELGKRMIQLSKEYPVSATEAMNASYVALSSGIKDVDTAFRIAELSVKGQTAQMGDAEDIARVLTAVTKAYGEENLSAAAAADILTAAIQEGKAEAEDFIGNIGRLVGIAPRLNVKFSELAASVAFLTNTGLTASEATTAVLGILNEIGQESPGQVKALKAVGLTFEDIRVSLRDKGLLQTLIDLNARFDEQGANVKEVFPAIRAYNGFLSLTAFNGKNAQEVLEGTQKSVGRLDEAVEDSIDTLDAQAKILRNQVVAALIDIGRDIAPDVISAMKELSATFKENEEDIKSFVTNGLKLAIDIIGTFIRGTIEIIALLNKLGPKTLAAAAAVGVLTKAFFALRASGGKGLASAFAMFIPGSPVLTGLALAVFLAGQLKEGFDTPIGRFGGQQNRQTGQRNLFGNPSIQGEVAALLKGQSFSDKALSRVTPGFLQDERFKEAERVVERLKKAGITTLEEFNKLSIQQLREFGALTKEEYEDMVQKEREATEETEKRNKALEDAKTFERDLQNAFHADQTAANELSKELANLAQEFKSSSEAAATLASPTEGLGLFGEISKKVADAFGLNGIQAGNVQGFDAVQAEISRADQKAFQFAKTLATVATAFEHSAQAANRIILGLARAAAQATQSAANAIFSTPTREVLNLNVQRAQNNLGLARTNLRVNPQIDALNKRMRDIDRAIRDADRQQRGRERERKRQEEAIKRAAEAQTKAIEDQLRAMKRANLIAEYNAEVQQRQMKDLIDANNKAQSQLQETFLKNNEALQRQINEAIGRGDEAGALALAKQQQDATKAYRDQSKTLQDQQKTNEQTLKDAERAEEIRKREADFRLQLLELDKEAIEQRAKEAQERAEHALSMQDDTDAFEDHKLALEDQKVAIEDQIAALEAQKDQFEEQGARIDEQIAVYQAQTELARAQFEAANKLALTQDEQLRLAKELTTQYGIETEAIRRSAGILGEHFIPEVEDARTKFDLLNGVLDVATNSAIRENFIDRGLNPATTRLEIFAAANEEAAAAARNNAAAQQKAADLLNSQAFLGNAFDAISDLFGFHEGGFTGNKSGIVHPNEVVLPLGNVARSREIMAQLPPGFASRIGAGGTAIGSIMGGFNVQGATLEDMRAVSINAVNEVFNQVMASSSRSGSLITPGMSGGSGNIMPSSAAPRGIVGITGSGGGGGGILAPIAAPKGFW